MRITKVVLALSLTLVTGCSTSRSLFVHAPSDPDEHSLGTDRQRITGYVIKDGRRVAFDGYVESRGDTLHFVRPRIESRGLELGKPMVVRDIPRDSVVAVDGAFTDVPRSVLLGIGLSAAIVVMLGLAWASNFTIWGS